MEYGILSNKRASQIEHISIAMEVIQDRRRNKKVPGARHLHEYANFYFDAHNPMLSACRDKNDKICVLRISTGILDISDVIIADRNASSDYVRFYPVDKGIEAIDEEMVFARSWRHPDDTIEEWRHKSIKCAEVLVPDRVDPHYIIGICVANETALQAVQSFNVRLPVIKKNGMFF